MIILMPFEQTNLIILALSPEIGYHFASMIVMVMMTDSSDSSDGSDSSPKWFTDH